MPRRIVIVAALALIPSVAAAQRADALRAGPDVPTLGDSAPTSGARGARGGGAVALRALTGVGGWVAGAYAGGYVGYQFRQRRGGDWEGVGEALAGAAVGGIVGSAFGASRPRFDSSCGDGQRFGRALGAAALGGAMGLFGFTAGPWGFLTVPVGSVAGSVVGASGCRRPGAG